ncbi:MAG: hypothetical protein QXG46_05950 [Ignisphaera sp.]
MIDLGILFEEFYLFIALAVLGDIVVERSGVLNLGIDGFIVFAIALTYTCTVVFNPIVALAITLASAIVYAILISLLINVMHLSHILSGLVLNMIFYGLSVVVGNIGLSLAPIYLGRRTLVAPITLNWGVILLISIAVSIAIWLFLYRSRIGVAIRACGFNPKAADHLGVKMWRTRFIALALGYIVIAFSGYVYTLLYKKSWSSYIGMGYGFLTLALAMASLWHPLIALIPVTIFSYLERSLYIYQLEYGIPQQILSMIPYIASIAFVTFVSALPISKRLAIPKALGEIYFKEERAA